MTVDEKIDYLSSMLDAQNKYMEKKFAELAAALRGSSGNPVMAVNEDDLDKPWGNPEIRYNPKLWNGESMVGKRLSDTSPEFLEVYAKFKDWQGKKDEEAGKTYENKRGETVPSSKKCYKDAAIARGWARRLGANRSLSNSVEQEPPF